MRTQEGDPKRITVKAADLTRGADMEGTLPGETRGYLIPSWGVQVTRSTTNRVKQLSQQFTQAV